MSGSRFQNRSEPKPVSVLSPIGENHTQNRNRSSRVPGRGRLLFSLRALLQRTEKFLSFRATPDEQRWAGRLHDELSAHVCSRGLGSWLSASTRSRRQTAHG